MSWLVQPRLVNGPFEDPAVFVDFRFGRRAILFDLGDITPLSGREMLRVSHAFVSHTHLDHFSGFDALLRLCMHRREPLRLFGPAGFCDRVEGKLNGYTWNLLDLNSPDFGILVSEFCEAGIVRAAEFRARSRFTRQDIAVPQSVPGVLVEEEEFCVEVTVLDHGTPCLAFALQETRRVNVWKAGLDRLGLPVGPWLNEAKRALRRGEPDQFQVGVPGGTMPLGELRERAFRTAPGQRVAYVTDAAATSGNIQRIEALARGADHLFIESVFLESDRHLAEKHRHLTAAEAGRIARRAGVRRLTPFHFSPRYMGREEDLRRELNENFNETTCEPSLPAAVLQPLQQKG
jgi:ribonuclease Z